PEGRVAVLVSKLSGLGDVGFAAEGTCEVAGDLGHLEAVGEPVADEVVALRSHRLGRGGQTAAGSGMHDPRAVTLERRALGRGHPLGRLGDPALAGGVVVARTHRAESSVATRGQSETSRSLTGSGSPTLVADVPRRTNSRDGGQDATSWSHVGPS